MLASFYDPRLTEAGCDEVGRGCLAGSVVAAAVVFPKVFKDNKLNDSKKLTEKERNNLRHVIMEQSISYAIGAASPQEIDEINILNASFLAMHRAIDLLKVVPELLLIDGNRYKPHNTIPYQCIVKGDAKYTAIAAASILAKTYRDKLMRQKSLQYPGYGWETNYGYPTMLHRKGIKALGVTPLHRKTFQMLRPTFTD